MKIYVFILLVFLSTNILAQLLDSAIIDNDKNSSTKHSSISLYELSSSPLSKRLFVKTNLDYLNDPESMKFDNVKFSSNIHNALKSQRPYIGFILFDSCSGKKFGDPVYGRPMMSSQEIDLVNFQRRLSPVQRDCWPDI